MKKFILSTAAVAALMGPANAADMFINGQNVGPLPAISNIQQSERAMRLQAELDNPETPIDRLHVIHKHTGPLAPDTELTVHNNAAAILTARGETPRDYITNDYGARVAQTNHIEVYDANGALRVFTCRQDAAISGRPTLYEVIPGQHSSTVTNALVLQERNLCTAGLFAGSIGPIDPDDGIDYDVEGHASANFPAITYIPASERNAFVTPAQHADTVGDATAQALADANDGIEYNSDQNYLYISEFTTEEVVAEHGTNVFTPNQNGLDVALGVLEALRNPMDDELVGSIGNEEETPDMMEETPAADLPDTLSAWSEWTEVSSVSKDVTITASYKGKTISTNVADVTVTEVRTRTVMQQGHTLDATAPVGELREERVSVIKGDRDEARANLMAELKAGYARAANALEQDLENKIKHGQKLIGDFENFILVINTTTAGIEVKKEFVVAKSGVDALTITPRLGVGGFGKGYKYTSYGAELAYENEEIRDLLIKVGYDTGTKFNFTQGVRNGFRGLSGHGSTADYGFVEIHQGADDEIKVTVRHDTQGDYKVGLRKGPYSVNVNQDGQVSAKYTVKF